MPEANPPALEHLGDRTFSFYPAIVNLDHNEWRLKRAAWSEILVANTKTNEEIWIPRRLVGEISSVDDPVLIIGLHRELEYEAGAVWPRDHRVLAMQRTGGRPAPSDKVGGGQTASRRRGPSPGAEGKIGRLIGVALIAGVTVILAVVAITQRPVSYKGREQVALELTADDTYDSIVRKIGVPSENHWRPDVGADLEYRALRYKDRPYTLVLMGPDRKSAHYIGALDNDWKPVHSVRLPGGGDTLALLRGVPKF